MNTNVWSRYTGGRERLHPFGFPASFSGFFFGVLAYLFLGLGLGYGSLGSVAVGVLAGLVFGLLVGSAVWLAGRLSRQNTVPWLAAGLLIGAAAGGVIAWLVLQFPNQPVWVVLPEPPEPAAAVIEEARLSPYGGELYVEGESGQIFGYACYNWLLCAWRPVDTLPTFPQYTSLETDCPPGEIEVQPLPGAVDRFTYRYCGQGFTAVYQIAVMEDGRVQVRREYQPGLSAGVLVPAFVLVGGALGLASPWIMARNRRKPVDANLVG